MAHFPQLPERANLEDLFRLYPKAVRPLLEMHDALLRTDDSELSIAERELIVTYVSVLNTCDYCFGAHRTMALAFGADPDVVDSLIRDIRTAHIDDRLRPLFEYARKVTLREAILPGDIRAALDAGWQERTLQDVLMITALYNCMNRIVDGAGLSAKLSYERPSADELEQKRTGSYLEWGKRAGFKLE